MDDLLQRLLEVDRQGDQTIKAAEEKASQIREEAASRLAAANGDFSKKLTAECAAIEKNAEENAERQRGEELLSARKEIEARKAKFTAAIAPNAARMLDELLGI